MDIPAKFASINPRVDTLLGNFAWKRHPLLPELEFYCLKERDDGVKKLLVDNGHSWQWPYLWDCGAVLGRWILDNSDVVRDKVVYDLGSGQGTAAIAAKAAGAKISIAIDCCVYSEFAIATNSDRNNQIVASYVKDAFTAKIAEQSVIFASDLIYGQKTSDALLDHLADLGEASTVIIAQSGRQNPPYQVDHPRFHHLMSYSVVCSTPGLEAVETMPVSLWTTNPLILQGL